MSDELEKDHMLELIHDLGGDEHAWIDFKEEYIVHGTPHHESEFIKDVQALANAEADRKHRYLVIGCDEAGNIVGVDEGAFDRDRERRRILSFDEDDLQQKIDGSLTPAPVVSLHTFEDESITFGVLVVRGVERCPVVATSTITDNGVWKLRKGDIWLRKASGKKLAEHDDIERFVRRRMLADRETILEGVKRVVELDPGTIAEIGSLNPSEKATADITFDIAPDGDYSVSGHLFQREFADLEDELNADIGKSRRSPDYFISLHSLMRYYRSLEPPGDDEALRVLFESSLRRWLPGVYWLCAAVPDHRIELIHEVPDRHAIRTTVCKVLVLAGEREAFERMLDESDTIRYPRFDVGRYRELFDDPIDERVEALRTATRIHIDPELDVPALQGRIRELAEDWLDASSTKQRNIIKYAIVNAELRLGAHLFSEDA